MIGRGALPFGHTRTLRRHGRLSVSHLPTTVPSPLSCCMHALYFGPHSDACTGGPACLHACMHACLPACLPACCSPAPQSCDLSLTFMFCCTDGTLSEDGQQIPWPRACGMGCVTVGNWTRGAGPAPAPPMPPKPPKGDWPGACCAASAFGCGVAPQKCGPTECTPTPWVNCTDGKPKYCIDCGFPPCPNSTQC